MPIPIWLRFYKRYRAECLAAAIGLLTFYPYRLFAFAWPWYSHALGQVVYLLARPFVPSLHLLFGPSPTLAGPSLNVNIIFACGGLEAIKLFQAIFALALILDWNVLNHTRLFFAYFAGLAATLAANAMRIALLVIAGNRISPGLVSRYHIDGSWLFFVLVFATFVLLTFVWLRSPRLAADSSRPAL
ncbi:MAG: exosortase/archaeosortase family protein [Actinomycetota bacterium]